MINKFSHFLDLSLEMSPLEHNDFIEGVDYIALEEFSMIENDVIEIREFFNYKNPLLYDVEIQLQEWIEKNEIEILFTRSAVSLCDTGWESSRTYYALEYIDKIQDVHTSLLIESNMKTISFSNFSDIETLLKTHQIDIGKFKEAYYSEHVTQHIHDANRLAEQYKLNRYPSFVIQGKYMVTGDHEQVANVITYLLEIEKMNIG